MSRIIISGAGIAGTVLAYWLGKHGFQVTVIERSLPNNEAGQIIDVEGPAQEIVKRMGVMESIQSKVTHEAGIRFVDEASQEFARFPAGKTGISNEIEIMRPELVKVLVEAADSLPNVTFLYGRQIQNLEQTPTNVTVTILEKSNQKTSTSTHDLLIAADGLRSPTRALILPPSIHNTCLYPLNAFTAFFAIPAQPQDLPWSTFHGTTGRKGALTKPYNSTITSAYLTTLQPSPASAQHENPAT